VQADVLPIPPDHPDGGGLPWLYIILGIVVVVVVIAIVAVMLMRKRGF
jgi:hypothetical protein